MSRRRIKMSKSCVGGSCGCKKIRNNCIVCGKKIIEDIDYRANSAFFSFGYGSKHDGDYFDIFLCDDCYVQKVADGIIIKNGSNFGKPMNKKTAEKWLKDTKSTRSNS